jgi:hypothetical protein
VAGQILYIFFKLLHAYASVSDYWIFILVVLKVEDVAEQVS